MKVFGPTFSAVILWSSIALAQQWTFGAANWGQPPPTQNAYYSFAQFNGDLFAGGRVISSAPAPNARILKSSDGGMTWNVASIRFAKSDHEVRRLWAASSGRLLAVTQSTAPSIYASQDGNRWSLIQTLDSDQSWGPLVYRV